MKDLTFKAALETVKLIARAEEKTTVRRVVFKLSRPFTIEQAEWLGDEAVHMRKLMQGGSLDKFKVPIDAYAANMKLAGSFGNAEAQVFGVAAEASMSSGDEPQPMLAITLEAHPEPKLLSFMAASMKEWIDIELLGLQQEVLPLASAVEKFQRSLEPFEQVSVSVNGETPVVLKDSSKQKGGAKKDKARP
jgi:hypothetical protein